MPPVIAYTNPQLALPKLVAHRSQAELEFLERLTANQNRVSQFEERLIAWREECQEKVKQGLEIRQKAHAQALSRFQELYPLAVKPEAK